MEETGMFDDWSSDNASEEEPKQIKITEIKESEN